jgi:HlyD family secretion protein
MKRVLSILLVLVVLAAFAGTVVFLWKKSQKKTVVYATESPKIATIVRKAVATGSVVPRKEVEIKPQISGIIDELYVEAGKMVATGDLIAKIRLVPNMVALNTAQSRVEKAKIALEQADADFERNQALVRDGTISRAAFQQFEIAVKNAREEAKAARDNLDLIEKGTSSKTAATTTTLVRSTIQGMVLDVPVEVGNSVIEANTFNAGTTIAAVADMGDMIFDGFVDESEVGKLKPGMALVLTIGAIESKKIEATLEHIAPKGVEKNGAIQFEIKAAIQPQADVLIRANYSANADIVLDRKDDVLALDEALLQFDGEKPYVEVEVAPQKFERREIQTGLSDGILIEIVAGLTQADKVKGLPVEKPTAAATAGGTQARPRRAG